MISSSKFWITMVAFQLVFGLTIFAITRQYYIQDAPEISARPTVSPTAGWPDLSEENDLANSISVFTKPAATNDPLELSRLADDAFEQRQFDQAADLYSRLLAVDPGNADTYNNLGLTLHYLGRSADALQVLNEGVTVNPTYQRIWLTLGFVNSQIGHIEQARSALSNAVELDANNEVGQSATQMLNALGTG